jgi:threonine/homoserine/homoserine lactone efflux protein
VIATGHLIAFLATVYVLVLIPGPSVLFVVSRGVALGRRAALGTVVGNTAGLSVQLALVCIGLGAILARSDAIYETLKLLGAAYLIVLGVRAIRRRGELGRAVSEAAHGPRRPVRIVREGFVVGVTNPKGLVMFTAVLPAFVVPAQGHAGLQLATLGAITVGTGLLSDAAWALAAGAARGWLGRSPKRLERMTAGGGLTMIALGIGLAVTGRRG